MAKNTTKARADLHDKLIDIAERIITTDGISGIKARPLAAEAGCSVGAIYNVFEDMNALVLAVNGRTFAKLASEVGEKGQDPNLTPTEALIVLAKAYLQFAVNHPKAWRALFDVELTASSDVPDWYRAELTRLFGFIGAPLTRAFPRLPGDDVALMTRALFSSVHGIVLLGVENRISGVPSDQIETMIEIILEGFMK